MAVHRQALSRQIISRLIFVQDAPIHLRPRHLIDATRHHSLLKCLVWKCRPPPKWRRRVGISLFTNRAICNESAMLCVAMPNETAGGKAWPTGEE